MLALIDREGEIAGAEELRHGPGFAERLHRLRVVLGITAHGAGRSDIGDHQPDRPVALGLEREDAFVFQRTGK
jgi:hypothetical protein